MCTIWGEILQFYLKKIFWYSSISFFIFQFLLWYLPKLLSSNFFSDKIKCLRFPRFSTFGLLLNLKYTYIRKTGAWKLYCLCHPLWVLMHSKIILFPSKHTLVDAHKDLCMWMPGQMRIQLIIKNLSLHSKEKLPYDSISGEHCYFICSKSQEDSSCCSKEW